jgi:hypothetical protein
MKKLLISILICALAIGLCACGVRTTTYPDGQEKKLSGQFTLIKKVSKGSGAFGNTCYYIYDNDTKIVYLYTCGGYHATMCPYYVIENNAPTIAVYGVNWNG